MAETGTNKLIFPVLLFLLLLTKGSSNCFPSQAQVRQTKIGEIPPGDEEYKVDIINPSTCTQTDIVLACDDFNSLEEPDHSVIDWDGNHIYVKKDIPDHSSVSFKYSWPHQQTITPSSSKQCC